MPIETLLTPWIGSALRHVNATGNRDILDFRLVGSKVGNRWNDPEDPTLYLAGDPGVLVAEWGRHLGAYAETVTVQRTVYRLQFSFKAVLDLREATAQRLLPTPADPHWFISTDLTRPVATHIRRTTPAQAMLVPSVAFPDDLSRWNLVVFLDKMPTDTSSWITRVERVGPLAWNPE